MPSIQYAKAFFDFVEKDEDIENFNEFTNALNSDFVELMSSPAINLKNKKDIVNNVLNKENKDLINFIYVLLDNNRFNLCFEINQYLKQFLNEKNKKINVSVFSTYELNKDELTKVSSSLEKKINKKINLINEVDESLIGGIKIVYDEIIIDNTIASKLKKMKANFR